ncbi:hydantoinase/oxoprolinase family protein [Actinomadura sp.]|jgi:N-methylhydantoinase A|uniref:hydantoinase/oxoprolinase family protein n=1 Tax=Actinomadura sp. TaxID=1989 RepID=UPI0037C89CDF
MKHNLSTRAGVDVGGTFTDLVAVGPDGFIRDKVLTTERQHEGFEELIGRLPDEARAGALHLLHGTTVVTNLILQEESPTVGLITTKGFRDILEFGLSIRPNPFQYVGFRKPEPLVPRPLRIEVDERLDADGSVLVALERAEAERAVRELLDAGCEAIAVCLLHSFTNPVHERLLGEVAARLAPGLPVSLSHVVDPAIREYERACTTVVNARSQPSIREYVNALDTDYPDLLYMHSGGGVLPAEAVLARPTVLARSGPAAGVLGASYLCRTGISGDLITFDMGGTSCDVAVVRDARPELGDTIDLRWDVPIRTLSIEVESVGAGGGSIAWIDTGGVLRVGPQSAGSSPGPACYGRGGTEPTVTDAMVVLGILGERLLGGQLRLDRDAAEKALSKLRGRFGETVADVARSVYRIVCENMALAIRRITVDKGIDPRNFTLVAFGGAGGQAGCVVADSLQIDRVVLPPHASAFSALGLLTADVLASESHGVVALLDEVGVPGLARLFDDLRERALATVGPDGSEATFSECRLDLRYEGQSHFIGLDFPRLDDLDQEQIVAAFEREHERLYGTRLGDPVEVVNVRALVRRPTPEMTLPDWPADGEVEQIGHREVAFEREPLNMPVLSLPTLRQGWRMPGPLIFEDVDTTCLVPPGWTASTASPSLVVLERDRRDG